MWQDLEFPVNHQMFDLFVVLCLYHCVLIWIVIPFHVLWTIWVILSHRKKIERKFVKLIWEEKIFIFENFPLHYISDENHSWFESENWTNNEFSINFINHFDTIDCMYYLKSLKFFFFLKISLSYFSYQ